ncbi:hypothetical protein [Amycolatopsis anabasis]|uniref:hypothetical protein n=1 Tax=Amycolatopsis anabasis TaxID=1840409 RepID=UPI00131ECF68|nr:hypothetical protein [Amycolatopsis anabasis]
MFGPLVGAYAVVTLLLLAIAGLTAVREADAGRRRDAYRVLKLLTTTAGGGGITAAVLKLHESGLL